MNLPSVKVQLEIAKVSNGYLVLHYIYQGEGGGGGGGGCALHIPSKEALMSWLANLEIKI